MYTCVYDKKRYNIFKWINPLIYYSTVYSLFTKEIYLRSLTLMKRDPVLMMNC